MTISVSPNYINFNVYSGTDRVLLATNTVRRDVAIPPQAMASQAAFVIWVCAQLKTHNISNIVDIDGEVMPASAWVRKFTPVVESI